MSALTLAPLSHLDASMFFNEAHDLLGARLDAFVSDWSAREAYRDDWLATREAARALGGAGLLSLCAPARDGGLLVLDPSSVDARALMLARERLASVSGLLDAAFAHQVLGAAPIAAWGTADQRARYLPELMSGERVGAIALVGADGAGAARARVLEEGDYLLTGDLPLVGNAGVASQYVVFAALDPKRRAETLTAFIVEPSDAGLRVEPTEMVAAQPVGGLALRRCRVPAARRLGAEGEGARVASEVLELARLMMAGAGVGVGRRALAEAGEVSGAHAVACGRVGASLEAAALLAYKVAYQRDALTLSSLEAAGRAKALAAEVACEAVDVALQARGPAALRRGEPLEQLYRDARALRLACGVSEALFLD